MVLPWRGRGNTCGRMAPAGALGLAWEGRVMLVVNMQGITVYKDTIGIIEAALWWGKVKIGPVVHITDTMKI